MTTKHINAGSHGMETREKNWIGEHVRFRTPTGSGRNFHGVVVGIEPDGRAAISRCNSFSNFLVPVADLTVVPHVWKQNDPRRPV